MTEHQFYLNGIDALSGGPLWDPQTVEHVVNLTFTEFDATPKPVRDELKSLSYNKANASYGFDTENLGNPAEAGWGVILSSADDLSIHKALQPLIDHRKRYWGCKPKVFEVTPDTTAVQFLHENGVERGIGSVEKVPYYLLIAADPRKISFQFQMELNTEYATGRIHFDTADEYAAYADALIQYEQSELVLNRREIVFWAPEREIDPATSKSASLLVQPLYEHLDQDIAFAKRMYRGDMDDGQVKPATKDNLRSVLSSQQVPAFLFTASHGMGYKTPHVGQVEQQGALLCQEYTWGHQVERDQWYGAEDLMRGEADVRGLVHFAYACFGAGTPQLDDYAGPSASATVIADHPFVAALPRALLSRGALAFVGHVERTWGYSFMASELVLPPNAITPAEAFQRAFRRILRGGTIGHSLRDEYDRAIHLSSSLLETISSSRKGSPVAPATLVRLWTERNDARAYMVIGDPATRLRVDKIGGTVPSVISTGASVIAGQDTKPELLSAPNASQVEHDSTTLVEWQSDHSDSTLEGAMVRIPPRGMVGDNSAETDSELQDSVRSEAKSKLSFSGQGRPGEHLKTVQDERDTPYLPPPTRRHDDRVDQELLVAWKNNILDGFKQNGQMFQKVLSAFLVPYWLTVAMYVTLFVFGLGGFALGTLLAIERQLEFAAIFGGLSTIAFLTFFISRPLRSLEQNIVFITWLGILYNTYWTQLMNATDPTTIRQDLEAVTKTAIEDLNRLASRQSQLERQRPDLRDGLGRQDGGSGK